MLTQVKACHRCPVHTNLSQPRLRTISVASALAGVLLLAACSGGDAGEEASSACAPSGAASEAVDAAATPGTDPAAEIDAPLSADATQRTVLAEGDGELPEEGDVLTVSFTAYNGTTGEELETTGHAEGADRVPLVIGEGGALSGLVTALGCASLGERSVIAIPPADAFGGEGNPALGLGEDDVLVFVLDVVTPYDASADMVTVEAGAPGFPEVTFAPDGEPTLEFPDTDPVNVPTLQIISEGTGQVVEEGDTVEVHYHGVNWDTGAVFDSSWRRGEPSFFPTTGVIDGFGAALEGQTVGTQLVVAIPSQWGYGRAGSGTDIGGTDTIVFAIDILGAESAG